MLTLEALGTNVTRRLPARKPERPVVRSRIPGPHHGGKLWYLSFHAPLMREHGDCLHREPNVKLAATRHKSDLPFLYCQNPTSPASLNTGSAR